MQKERNSPPFDAFDVDKLDDGIVEEVRALWENGVETTESCQGGKGHLFPEPTVRFTGDEAEGLRAVGVALRQHLGVVALRRVWEIQDGKPLEPKWEMVFHHHPEET